MQPVRKRPNPYLNSLGFGGRGFGDQTSSLVARLLQNPQFNMPPQAPPTGTSSGGLQWGNSGMLPPPQPFQPMPFEGSGQAPYAPFGYNKKRMF